MNKIANYLNSNLTGEAVSRSDVLNDFAHDRGVLSSYPNVVVFANTSEDIRRVASLSFQLAKKKKLLPINVCGYRNDTTGGCLSDGLLVNTTRYMSQVLDFDPDQALIHVQAGTELTSVNLLAKEHDLALPLTLTNRPYSIGEIISNNTIYPLSSNSETIFEMVDQLQVILANGTTLQTKPLKKRELNQKFGLSTTEGEIYRKIDALIEENQDIISAINLSQADNSGYANIARVKTNSVFNLTPLLIGAQGTLGIISEAIIRLEEHIAGSLISLLSFTTLADALEAAKQVLSLKPAVLDFFEQTIFDIAAKAGKAYPEIVLANKKLAGKAQYHLLVQIPARNRLVFHRLDKKLTTIIHQTRGFASHERLMAGSGQFSQLGSIHNVMNLLNLDNDQKISTELAVGASISLDKWQAFAEAVNKLSTTIGMSLPIYGSALTGVLNLQTSLDLRQITEKQKSLKILNAYATLVNELGGKLCASGGEGQLKGIITSKQISPELSRLYTKIKAIFDPYGILAPKIKRPIELRDIAGKISPNYDRF